MRSKIYYLAFILLLIGASATVMGQGLENFNNSNATSAYADGSFVGENSVTWTYVASRDENGDANGSGIDGKALMLRQVSDLSSVSSSTVSGGIGNDFSFTLYKGFTGGGDRQVELFINNVSFGITPAFDDYLPHTFSWSPNVSGDVEIRIENVTAKQVIVDDITWNGYSNVQGLENFNNSNATSSYADASFVGEDGITWNYIASRDENGDANGSGIDGNALMLRRASDFSSVSSEIITGGIENFSVKLYKGFTGGGDRQVELFINGFSYGVSDVFDDFAEHTFTVSDINVVGDYVISLKNTTEKQIIVDDISWNFSEDGGDVTPPEVAEGGFTTATDFYVTYTEPVTQASAENTSNYAVTPGMTVTGLTLSASMDTVFGTVTPGLVAGVEYTVDITGVVDTSANANVMVPFTTSFYFNDYSGTDLIISEISYAQPSGGIQDIDYFEVYNKGATDINMTGMYFTQGVNLDINTSLVVAAGEYYVFCEVLDSFNLAFPAVLNVMQWESGSLSGGGEDIEIVNSLGDQVSYVDYETNSAPWPSYSDTKSHELCDLGSDYTIGSNWRYASVVSSNVAATLYGSPGSANSCEAFVVTDVATMADLRAGAMDGSYYRLTGEAIVTYARSSRNQKYIQDATGAILIDDSPGVITTTYVRDDGMTDLVGSLDEFGGVMQFKPYLDPGAPSSTGTAVIPEVVALSELKSNFEDYESELILVNDVVFSDAGAVFASGNNYEIVQAPDTGIFRTLFSEADYIGGNIPAMANVTSIAAEFNGTAQIVARDAADFELPPTSAITFRVDMSQSGLDLSLGVYLMGTVTDWGPGAMMDSIGDMVYELTLDLETGDYEYKFRTGTDTWEDLDGDIFPGGNRALTVVAGENQVLEYCWESTQACSDVATSITFKVDMNFSGEDLGSGVYLMGTVTDWDPGVLMDDSDGDLIYELTVDVQPNTYLYKFKTGAGTWESISNRLVTLIDGVPQVLPAVCWNSNDLCPYPGITITAPEEGSTSTSADVTVDLVVVNFVVGNPGDGGVEGHIHWKLDGADQAMKFDTDPIALTGLADGDHTVILTLVDNDHVELDPIRSDTVTFNVNTTIVGGGMETFTLSNATSTYADGSYVGDNGITWNYVHSRDDNGDANGSGIAVPALMLRRMDEPSSVFSESIPDGVGSFSVKLYKGFTGGGDRQVEVFINDVSYGVSAPFDDFDMHLFTVDNINVPGDVVIRIDNVTPKQVIVDDISWTGYAGEAVPGIVITAPIEGSTSQFADVTVNFTVQNFMVGNPGETDVEGHIHWALDGVDQAMKFDTDPIELTGLADGGHTVIMKLVDNDHADLDPSVADTVNFTVALPEIIDVATIADLRAGNQDGTIYRLTGEAVVTFEQSFRGQKYIQDVTGAVLIDDPSSVVTTAYIRYDGMTGITGTLTEYGGVIELVPFVDPGAPSSSENVVTPEVVTLAELSSNFENYESELILVNDVVFAAGGAELFETSTNYDISDPSGDGIFRTLFFGADYIASFIPVEHSNITCLATEFDGTTQIVARDLADFDLIDAVNEIDKANFSFYPNPNNGQFTLINDGNSGEYLVELIDLTGKVIYSENISLNNNEKHVINAGDVVSGIYLVKLINTQDSYSRTMRMIVR